MDDRYAKAIIDELERIGDLLSDLLKLETAKILESGFKGTIPTRTHRRVNEQRSAKVDTGGGREQP